MHVSWKPILFVRGLFFLGHTAHLQRARRLLLVLATISLVACLPKESEDSESYSHCVPEGAPVDRLSEGSASRFHCAISDGHVKCWGENDDGQLGLGFVSEEGTYPAVGDSLSEMGRCLPEVDLGSDFNAVQVVGSNGANHCALSAEGKVKCWGGNYGGELGLGYAGGFVGDAPGEMGDHLPYMDLGEDVHATMLAASTVHYCALLNTGQIRCWGRMTGYTYNPSNPGFIGDDPEESGENFYNVTLPLGKTAVQISGSCAVLNSGELFCWRYECQPDNWNYLGPDFTCVANKD
jgi:hypothetical protein